MEPGPPEIASGASRSKLCTRTVFAAGACVLLGLLLARAPFGTRLQLLSYDTAFLAAPASKAGESEYFTNVILVAFSTNAIPERTNHAALLDRLTADGARLVVFDVLFKRPKPEQDDVFAAAIRRNGRVLLAAELEEGEASTGSSSAKGVRAKPLVENIENSALGVGSVHFPLEGDNGFRAHALGTAACPSLPYQAAKQIVASLGSAEADELWLNFYTQPSLVPTLEYDQALHQAKGYFQNKIVFVGAQDGDVHETPLSRWGIGTSKLPGVTILALNFLNLWRGDSFVRMSAWKEYILIIAAGLLLGWTSVALRPPSFITAAILLSLAIAFLAVWGVWRTHVWFNWGVISLCQAPVAATVSLVFGRARRETVQSPMPVSPPGKPAIPAHTVHYIIGRGGFGEVWLSTNATLGTLRAIKVVRREKAGENRHYDYEIKAIQSYEPISRKHEGLLQVLQVGQDDQHGFFYYVMELADDAQGGKKQSLEHYHPRTLAADLDRGGKLALHEAIALGVQLAGALEFLHAQRRVHRDIKPANIIYLGGKPKLGDPGLVTTLDRSQISKPGTPQFMDAETHGSALGDIYSLGQVLRMVVAERNRNTGDDSADSPPVSGSTAETEDPELGAAYDLIIRKACAAKDERYQSATELRDALRVLQDNLSRAPRSF